MSCKAPAIPLNDRLTGETPFVLLESRRQDAENFQSLFFGRPAEVLSCRYGDSLGRFFSDIDRALGAGLWVAGYFTYELGYLLEDKLADLIPSGKASAPLAWVGLFDEPTVLDHRKDSTQLLSGADGSLTEADLAFELDDLRLNTTRDEYGHAVSRIKSYIESGDTYQVNFTVKYRFSLKGSPASLYLALRERQKVGYAALLWDGQRAVISLSPELFFRKDGLCLQSKPMKGTARRGRTPEEDESLARWLANDPKNRAENVMIVDLIRNDLGRLAPPGGVGVPRLFEVERYETLFQMTSTVEARLASEPGWYEVFKALFPCGSVTGAPKIRTMEIIAELEKGPRGVYTGAIGYISPQGQACFNVAIRTVVVEGHHNAEMGIGSGIVYDSDPVAEYEECLLKGRFLTQERPTFSLIETMLLEAGEIFILDRHLKRLEDSAGHLDFVCPIGEIERSLVELAKRNPGQRLKIRLALERSGDFEVQEEALEEQGASPLLFRVAEARVSSLDPFLYHKTTHRLLYRQERDRALAEGFDEVVFLNEREEITEGTISNLFVELSGQLYTPPVFCGLLPGTLRQSLLDDGKCKERILTLKDLEHGGKVYLGNSVRGLVEAVDGKRT